MTVRAAPGRCRRRARMFPADPPRASAPSRAVRRLTAPAAALCLLALSACGAPVLTPAGPVSRGERQILFDSLAIMLTIVVPTILATLAFAWWFRASNPRARRLPDWAYSGKLELMIWSAPLLTILFLGGLTWISSHDLDPAKPLPTREKPLDVQVVSLDWKWLFVLPEQGVAAVNTLTVPAGRPVRFHLTSASVMNAFFVPQLGSMIYTMNGMTSQLQLQADRPGDYWGRSAHFSGDGFPGMQFVVHAAPTQAFDAWVAQTRAAGPVLDGPAYAALARQSADVKPFTYRAVQPGLYNAVVAQRIAPAPGPRTGQGGPGVFPKPLAEQGS